MSFIHGNKVNKIAKCNFLHDILDPSKGAHHGGVVVLYRKADHFTFKVLPLHSPNFISFHLVMVRWRWHVVGCCISPRDASPIEGVAVSIRDQPYGDDLLVVGNLNSNIAEPEGTPWGGAIVDELAAAGLKDMVLRFLTRCKPWLQDRCTWGMRRDGKEVRSRTVYIIVTDRRLFQDVAVRGPLNNSDYYMVLSCL